MKIQIVPIENIHVDLDDNYRRSISEDSIRDLHKSFVTVHERTNGERWMLSPVDVVKLDKPVNGKEYQLRIGYRRFLAAQYTLEKKPRKYAWAAQLPVYVQKEDNAYKPGADVLMMMIENIQRDSVNPMDEAHACKRAMDEADLTVKALGQALGRTKGWVSQRLSLLELCDEVQASLATDEISFSHAREICRLKEPEAQAKMADLVDMNGWDVKDTKYHVSSLVDGEPTPQTQHIADGMELPPKGEEKPPKKEKKESKSTVRVREVSALLERAKELEETVTRYNVITENASPAAKPSCAKQTAFYVGAQTGIAWAMGELSDIHHGDLYDEEED